MANNDLLIPEISSSIPPANRDRTYDTMDMIVMRLAKGMSLRDIEKITGKSRTAISNRIRKLVSMFDPESIAAFERHKPNVLSGVEKVLLQDLLDPQKRNDASLNNVAYAYNQVAMQNKLARGQATAIVDVGRNIRDIEELKTQADVLINGLLAMKR